MSTIEKTIVVDVPVDVAYAQWTQFESFPVFMEGVDRVVQLDDRTLEWTATVAGREKRWTARITDQTPGVGIAWRSLEGAQNDGAVLFTPAGEGATEIRLVVEADPDGIVEEVGDRLGFLQRRIAGDLERFKTFIEGRERPTGSWDGAIRSEEVVPPESATPAGIDSARGNGP